MKTFSIILAFFVLISVICYQVFSLAYLQKRSDRFQAEEQFYRAAVTQVCLDREAVIYAAETQDFRYAEFGETMEQQFISPVPNGTIRSVVVYIKPDPFFYPVAGAEFHFGQDGCRIIDE